MMRSSVPHSVKPGRVPAASLPVLLMIVALLAGCAEDTTPGSDRAPEPTPTLEAPGPGEPPVEAEPGLANETTFYFTEDGGLAIEAPEAGAITLGASPAGLVAGDFKLIDLQGAPAEAPYWFETAAVDVTVWVRSDVPLASNQLFDVAVWGGTTRSMPLFTFDTFPGGALAPDVATEMTFRLEFDDLMDLYVPVEDALRFHVASMSDLDTGVLEMLVGGDHASHVRPTLRASGDHLAERGDEASEDFEGVLRNMSMTDCPVMEGTTHEFHDVEVPEGTVYLEFLLALSGGVTNVDLDFDLFDGDRHVGGGHRPYPDEGMLFVGPTAEDLAGKTLQLRVSTCTGLEAPYTATVLHAPAA